jgi:four helix bundle protein
MNYAEWLETVPREITDDPIWNLEIYRLALFAGDIGWHDVVTLSKTKLMFSVADQLHRSLGSISANLTEGYSRSKGLERARYFEIALGSARESRDWYYKSKNILSAEVVEHRIRLITHIIGMLVSILPHQRKRAIREASIDYLSTGPEPSNVHDPVPFS